MSKKWRIFGPRREMNPALDRFLGKNNEIIHCPREKYGILFRNLPTTLGPFPGQKYFPFQPYTVRTRFDVSV